MRLELFAPDLSNRHEVTHAISVQMEKLYNGIGKCSLVLTADAYNTAIAENGAILYFVERQISFEIVEVLTDRDQNELTLNGYSLNSRLNRRVVAASSAVTNVEAGVYAMASANLRGLGMALAPAKGLPETVEETTLYGDGVLNAVMPLLDAVGLGQQAVFDYRTGTITWEVYRGVDRTSGLRRVVFSLEQGTAPGLVIDRDRSGYKNVCYCTASYQDGTEFVAVAGDVSGAERRELWSSYAGDAQAEGESNPHFLSRVKQYAALQLGNCRDRIGFTVDVGGDELGTLYNVGDIVCCVSLRDGVRFTARIFGATWAQDANGQSAKLTIGDPILTVLEA